MATARTGKFTLLVHGPKGLHVEHFKYESTAHEKAAIMGLKPEHFVIVPIDQPKRRKH